MRALPEKKFGGTEEERALYARLLELALRAEARGIPQYSDFLTPAERAFCLTLRELAAHAELSFYGGYPEAERVKAVLAPRDCRAAVDPPVTALALHYKGPPLSHRDLLGALMALGLRREKLGDIVTAAEPPVLLCDRDLAPYIAEQLERAGRNRIRALPAELDGIPPPKTQEKTFTVASPRLDSILAGGFSISRTDAAEHIRRGDVSVDWKTEDSPSQEIAEGSRVALRGYGKMVVARLGGASRKGRLFVTVERDL